MAEGFAANLTTLTALQQRLCMSNEQAAAVCCVSDRTYRRWLRSGKPDPCAVRLLAVLAGFVPWVGWDGWEVHNGHLFPPGYRRGGIPPGEFFALVFYRQQVAEYQRVNRSLQARLQAFEKRAAGYPGVQLLAELSGQIAELGARVQAAGADLVALSARTCNTGTLSHGWDSGGLSGGCSSVGVTPSDGPDLVSDRRSLRVANAG